MNVTDKTESVITFYCIQNFCNSWK